LTYTNGHTFDAGFDWDIPTGIDVGFCIGLPRSSRTDCLLNDGRWFNKLLKQELAQIHTILNWVVIADLIQTPILTFKEIRIRE
jgi:hypothetical protein